MTANGRQGALAASELRDLFGRAAGRILPRILTQVNRDVTSPSRGCFDRNWWHYKIRDFPSVILQQGAYTLAEAADLEGFRDGEDGGALLELAVSGARFWNERAVRRGAFEEYYPWEQGYPPLAFSTLAIAKLVRDGHVGKEDVLPGIRLAVKQLTTRFEERAGNQQVAGLAALGVLKEAVPGSVEEDAFDRIAGRTLGLQHEEGWYMEYDGPDLGYLAVTIDCLWDLHDATGEARFLDSARRALRFIAGIVGVGGASAGMLNARNTDYLVPYGIVRFALEGGEDSGLASNLASALYGGLDEPDHFLAAIDDRYLSHYVGHSFVRALRLLEQGGEVRSGDLPEPAEDARFLPGCGYLLQNDGSGMAFLGALKKGGVFTWSDGERRASDFGWQVESGGVLHFNHWWSADWKIEVREGELEVSGNLFSHSAAASGPGKHFVLRVLSFTLGSRIIGWLKSKLIFKNSRGSIHLTRLIRFGNGEVVVEDRFDGLHGGSPVRAPRASKRHVSSADSYHPEDLALCRGVVRSEKRRGDGSSLTIETRYTPASTPKGP